MKIQTRIPTILFDLSNEKYLYRSEFKGAEIECNLECDDLSEANRRAKALEVTLNKPDRGWLEKLKIEIR